MTTETTFERPTADYINDWLRNGGCVRVGTYLRYTDYKPKHAGMFTEGRDGCLYVARGKSRDCLSSGQRLLVSLRLYREV